MTALNDTPVVLLHGETLVGDEWWACMEPERPFDGMIVFDEHCQRCAMKARAVVYTVGDRVMFDCRDPQKRPAMLLSEIGAGQ